jgi:hypothetical protein
MKPVNNDAILRVFLYQDKGIATYTGGYALRAKEEGELC